MKKQKYKTMYMHTLDGEPAAFYPYDGLVLLPRPPQRIALADSLRQLRKEQKIDREIMNGKLNAPYLDYVLVKVPA